MNDIQRIAARLAARINNLRCIKRFLESKREHPKEISDIKILSDCVENEDLEGLYILYNKLCYDNMTRNKLRELARNRNITEWWSMDRATLIVRLCDYDSRNKN